MTALHKFEKVLAKHGFVISSHHFNDFSILYANVTQTRNEYIYRNPKYEGNVLIWVYNDGRQDCFHYYKQSNGIIAPSQCDTAPQLDRNLSRHYQKGN